MGKGLFGTAKMIVKMKSGAEYIISDARGQKLRDLLQHGPMKEYINLDGRGMMIRTSLIEKVYSETPVSANTEAWKKAIRKNLDIMRETGKMGTYTANDFL